MHGLMTAAYLAAALLFILALSGLSTQETARRGNLFGVVGMVIAIAATFLDPRVQVDGIGMTAGAVILGGVVGAAAAARVAMTSMPQMVAALHSFVGLAAVLVGISTFLDPGAELSGGARLVHEVEIWLDVAIGSITFTGSVVAWGKLEGRISGKPLLLPGRHAINALMAVVSLGMVVPFVLSGHGTALVLLLVMTAITAVLGAHLVLAIGGADMPVVVSMLNSYSGWAAAAAGFMLGNDLLIVTGALVGSSGAILSIIMCRAMNRSIWNVMFGGFGTEGGSPSAGAGQVDGEVTPTTVDEVAAIAKNAKNVVIVPGYGMAVARAQHLVHEFESLLRKKGVNVRYAIHPVAGRLPGHMNVLLAEAGVPYDIVLEMDDINDDLPDTDLVLVIGANDIVNPGAETDESSPIYGMPVLQVWKSGTVVVLKRGMGTGFSGVQNPLFFHDHTRMLFGDARESMQGLVAAVKD